MMLTAWSLLSLRLPSPLMWPPLPRVGTGTS